MGRGATPCLSPLLWLRAPLTQCREVQAVKGERPLAVPRARLACPVRSFGWGRRTWASKVLPREGLRPQMHRGAGAHCVTARPVLVERNTAAPSPGRRGGVGGAGSSRGCVSAGEWCPEARRREQVGGEKGAVCRTACAKNRQSAACVLPAPPGSLRRPLGHRVPADVVTRTLSALPPAPLSAGRGGAVTTKASDLRPAETTRRT